MSPHDALQRARNAFTRHAWREACDSLAAVDRQTALAPADLECLATAAYLAGEDDASIRAWTRAHRGYLREADVPRAARCTFWLILALLESGAWARASGWLATGQRLLDGAPGECPERGLLLVLEARAHARDRNLQAAYDAACRAVELGNRFDDPELKLLGRLAQALALTRRGDPGTAVRLFDEVMVGVTTWEVSPIAVGTAYCAVLDACGELLDVARAREWTEALTRWCGVQPDLVPFRGQCLVHRAETMRLCGDWAGAAHAAEEACRQTSRSGPTRTGAAWYERAEIHRMRGRFAEAEDAYQRASEHGRLPEPGLALLRLAQARLPEAAATIRRELAVPHGRSRRAPILAACVEIMIAAGDLATARHAADELERMAAESAAPLLRAVSSQARGALLLADGQPHAAFDRLNDAWMAWQALDVPYEAARARVLMGDACRQLGDEDAAVMAFSAARRAFQELDAAADLAHLDERHAAARGPAAPPASSPLTPREREVIRLVAGGRTNRAIAEALAISERTVDRHVSNILTKLDLPSRSAATAYAYEHGLV